jgi:hypothetical protein
MSNHYTSINNKNSLNNIIGKITIYNKTDSNISVTVVKYDYENFTDINPFPINQNSFKTWERYLNNYYFCFLSESRVLYGFLCKGGINYEYLGKGKMRLPDENRLYKLDYDVTYLKHYLRIFAILENVQISIFKEKHLKTPVFTTIINKNTDLKLKLPDGYYYLKIKDDETVYGVIPGKCYYIAKSQVVVGTKDNIIIKPHKDSDINKELE